jgi:hypothetical protein
VRLCCHLPFRWLVVGPARSGASWHVDPSATSAWNTLLSGGLHLSAWLAPRVCSVPSFDSEASHWALVAARHERARLFQTKNSFIRVS